MHRNKSISLVIPCLNEEKGIQHVIARVPSCVDQIIVIDNGSTDKTATMAASMGARVIIQNQKGYGRAYKTGFQHCQTDLIVTADGDGTYPVEMIPHMVDHLIDAKGDFVSGKRFPLVDKRVMPKHLLLGNLIITSILRIIFQIKLEDGLSGMWLFNRNILDRIILKSNRWSFSQEIKIETHLHGFKCLEFHIPYSARIGESKLGPILTGLENIAYLCWHKIQWVFKMRK